MKKILIVSVFIVLLSACKDKAVVPGPITSANIHGDLILYDESVNQVIDQGGMVVTVEGTSPVKVAASDTNGEFTILDVPFGTYDLSYFKEGYGVFKIFDIVHQDSTGAPTVLLLVPTLGKLSSTQITLVETNATTADVTISSTLNPPASNDEVRFLRFFYHTESTVSDKNYLSYSDITNSKLGIHQQTLTKMELNNMGFTSGTTVFVKVYGDSFYSNTYDDPESGLKVFPNLNQNSALAVSFVVP
jgi:hypothetical protein